MDPGLEEDSMVEPQVEDKLALEPPKDMKLEVEDMPLQDAQEPVSLT